MNEKVVTVTELCARSRHEGLTKELHQKKRDLMEELVLDEIMYKDDNGCYWFHNKEDSKYFTETTKNWKK